MKLSLIGYILLYLGHEPPQIDFSTVSIWVNLILLSPKNTDMATCIKFCTRRIKVMYLENSHSHLHQLCDLQDQRQEKSMRYENLACLFVVMISGILMSLLIILFEYISFKKVSREKKFHNNNQWGRNEFLLREDLFNKIFGNN